MANELFDQLLTAVKNALKKQDTEESLRHITQTFQHFKQEKSRLQQKNTELEYRLAKQIDELTEKNLQAKKALLDLKFTSAYLNSLLKNLKQGILFIDTDGLIISHNETAGIILQKKTSEFVLKNYFQIFSDEYFGFSMKEALSLGIDAKALIKLDDRQIEAKAFFVSEAPAPYQGLLLILKDITATMQLKEEAERTSRLKEIGQMTASVAHDIKNPLGAIRGLASLLIRDLENNPPLKELASQIISAAKMLERLVFRLLHFTRPLQLNLERLNLTQLVKDLIKLVQADPLFSDEIFLKCHIPGQALYAYVDKELFLSALLNLARNALEAVDNTGNIVLSLIKNNDRAVIDIADNGRGMTEEELQKLFAPFFSTKETGHGLGLSEARKIITAHTGKIEVRSDKGRGTVFTVSLPLNKDTSL